MWHDGGRGTHPPLAGRQKCAGARLPPLDDGGSQSPRDLRSFGAPAPAVAEMERQMRISEDILRFMTIRVDELESEPSVMMQKRDRDERKDRERRERDGDGASFGGNEGEEA